MSSGFDNRLLKYTLNKASRKHKILANTTTTILDLGKGFDYFYIQMSSNTALQFNNLPSNISDSGVYGFSFCTVNLAAAYTLALPANCQFAGGFTPTRTTASGAKDLYFAYTDDGGATWGVSLSIEDQK